MAIRVDDVDLGRDRSLVERFQAGDAAAFDDLYRRYFQRLYRFCFKRLGDQHEAEEVAEEAFARAYLHLERLDGERRFYPWMTVIAARLCVDSHRRNARSQPSDEIDPGVVEGGQEAVLEGVDVGVLNQAFARLAPRHQQVLDLRERQLYSYQGIADHLEVSLGTVETLLWRARRALRREFLALDQGAPGVVALAALRWGERARRFVASAPTRVLLQLGDQRQALAAGTATAAAVGALTLAIAPSVPTPSSDGTPQPPSAVRAPIGRPAAPPTAVALAGPSISASRGPRLRAPAPVSPAAVRAVAVVGAQAAGSIQATREAQNLPVHIASGGLVVGIDPVQVVAPPDANRHGYLWCAAVAQLQVGYCQTNPLG